MIQFVLSSGSLLKQLNGATELINIVGLKLAPLNAFKLLSG